MPRQNLKVIIENYPYFDNVVVHEPGAEVTLADRRAFSNVCMKWVEEPETEAVTQNEKPGIPASTSVSVVAASEQTRRGDDPGAEPAEPARPKYSGSKRKRAKRIRNPKGKTLPPALLPAPSTEEAATLVTAPGPAEVPALVAAPPEAAATPTSEPPASSGPTPPFRRDGDVSPGNGEGKAEHDTSALPGVA